MAKLSKIIANTLGSGLVGIDENNVMYCLTDEALNIWTHFSACDVNDSYKCSDISKMLSITISFQYYWLDQKGNFDEYGIIHEKVMDYIYNNFEELLKKSLTQIISDLYQKFN